MNLLERERMGRFKCLVESEEGMVSFRAQYRIPPNVNLRYCEEGEWFKQRRVGEVVIPMIAFIEGGMRIPMGRVMRDYLRFYRLAPTQCVPNVFRILGCVDALNDKMGLGLTHHDVNWVYNLHHLKGKGYYLKTRQPKIRLIQCLPKSSKGLNKDLLIVSGEWHNGLPCLMQEGQPGVVLEIRTMIYSLLTLICVVSLLTICTSCVLQINALPSQILVWLTGKA